MTLWTCRREPLYDFPPMEGKFDMHAPRMITRCWLAIREICRQWRRELWLFVGCIVLVLLTDGWPLVGLLSEVELKGSLADEYSFVLFIRGLQDRMLDGDLAAPFKFGMACAYGSLFWTGAALLSLPLRLWGWEGMVIGLRIAALVLKASTLACVVLSGRTPGERNWVGAVLGGLLLSMPAFAFFGKVISSEYLLTALAAAAYHLLLADSRQYSWRFWTSLLLIGLATATKSLAVYLALPWIAMWPGSFCSLGTRPTLARTSLVLAGIVVIGLHGLFSHSGLAAGLAELRANAQSVHAFSWQGVANWYSFDNVAWDGIPLRGLATGFTTLPLLLVMIAIALLGWRHAKQSFLVAVALATPLMSGLLIMGLHIQHPWYLFASAAAWLVALGHATADLPKQWHARVLATLTLVLVINLAIQGPHIVDSYAIRLDVNRRVAENHPAAAAALAALKSAPSGSRVAFDHWLPMDTSEREDLRWSNCGTMLVHPRAHEDCDFVVLRTDADSQTTNSLGIKASPLRALSSLGNFWNRPFEVDGKRWRFEPVARFGMWQVLERRMIEPLQVAEQNASVATRPDKNSK